MSTPVKMIGFVAALAALFGVAVFVGNAVGPVGGPVAPAHDAGHQTADGAEQGHDGHQQGESDVATADVPGGLMVSQNGYTLDLPRVRFGAGRDVPVSFSIAGPDGRKVRAYDTEHDKQLHLIAVRRDYTGFQHVHPVLGTDGTWATRLDLTPGQWRLFADFKPTGEAALTLGADLNVAGDFRPAAPAPETRTANVDGYAVTLHGGLTPGRRLQAHHHCRQGRPAGHRSAAIPRRVRPPGRAAGRRPGLPARAS